MSLQNSRNRLTARPAALAGTVLFLAGTVVAQVPVEIEAVTLRSRSSDARVHVQAATELAWRSSLDENGRLIVELPETVPGPKAVSMVSPTGLVASVDVGFSVPGGVPTTRLVVAARNPFDFEVKRSEGVLRMMLQSGVAAGTRGGPGVAVESVVSDTAEIQAGNHATSYEIEELRERLVQSESRQTELERRLEEANSNASQFQARTAELHKDRLELLAELRSAQEAMARPADAAVVPAVAAAVDGGELGAVQQSQAAVRLAEVEGQLEAMRSAAERANAELAGRSRELLAERAAGKRASARVGELETELEAQARLLAEQQERAKQVGAELLAAQTAFEGSVSREAEATRRARLLAEAPGLLDAERFVVSPEVDPCLNLRGEPGTEGSALDCLGPRTEVQLVDFTPDWFKVRLADNREGWLAREFLEPSHESRLESVAGERDRTVELLNNLRREKTALELRLKRAREAIESLESERVETLSAGSAQVSDLKQALAQTRQRLEQETEAAASSRQELTRAHQQVESTRNESQAWVAQALSLVDTLVVSADVDSCLSLRAGPSKKERAVDCLAAGTRASAVDAVADWILVRLRDDRRGWVSAAYLEPASSRELRETREAESRSRAAAVEAERSSAAATTAQQQSDAERARLSDALEASRAETAAMRTQFGIRISELDGALKQVRAENEQLKAEVGEKRLAALSLLGDDEVTVLAEPCLRLRAAASVEGRQIDCLAKGTRARVVDLLEGWTRLELADGRVGWTSAGFLEPVRREEERKSAARLVVVEEAHRNLEKDTQSLKAERDDLDRKLTNLRLESARFEAELASLRQAEGRATALEGELATARETLSATEKGGTELRARLLELETERDQLRGTLEREKSQGAEAVATLAEARSETESARSEASMLRERVAELESMSSASAELEQQLETMRNQLAASEDGRQKQAALIEEIERARGELAVRLEVIDSERQTLASRTEAAEIERAAAAAALTAARHELARVEEVERPAAIESEDLEVPSEVAEVAASMERAPDVGDLEAVARAWAAAWSEQRVADYLYFYSSDFLPANGMSRSAWEDLRRRRVSAPESIEVELSDLTVRIDANGDASVTFSQAYRSNTFADQVLKTLELVREDGLWKIRSEQTQ